MRPEVPPVTVAALEEHLAVDPLLYPPVVQEEPASDSAPDPAHGPSVRRPPLPLNRRGGSRDSLSAGLAWPSDASTFVKFLAGGRLSSRRSRLRARVAA